MSASGSRVPIECIGFDKPNAKQMEKIKAIIESQAPGDLLAVRLYPNLDVTNEEEMPSGVQLIMNPGAKVDPTLISSSLFQVFAVSKVHSDEALTDDYFASKSLKDAVDQFPAQPLKADIRSLKTNVEKQAWAPELGGPGSFVGVYSKAKDGDFRNKDYFIAARGTAPLLVKDLRQRIASQQPKGVTFRDLLNKDEWRSLLAAGEQGARRNVFRNIANAAEACEVTVQRIDDNAAFLADPNHAPPEMAVPDWEQNTFSIRSGVYNNKPAVLLSYGVVPAQDCLLMKDQLFFVVANAYDGVAAFKVANHNKIQAAHGLPSDTGRKMAYEEVPRNEQAYKGRMNGVAWDVPAGQINSSIHADLHVDSHHAIGPLFKQSMMHMGWNATEHVEKLLPLPLKIYNPELKRN